MLAGFAKAQLAPERVWTGVNGKSFSGVFHRLAPDRKKADFLTKDGKLVTVALENLVTEDRELILNPPKVAAADPGAAGELSKFKPVATPNRMLIPSLDPKTFGCSTEESLVDALWISLLWWDQTKVLEVPKKGDLESKAEWLHKKLTRAVAVDGKSASAEEAKEGVEAYFSDELKEVAACRINIEQKDFSAARLGGFLQGSNVLVMKMSMLYSNGRDFAVSSVLESISGDGKFVFHVFGRRLTGQLRPVEKEKQKTGDGAVNEYVLDRPGDLPDYYATNGARFFMGKESWNAAIVLKPYVYLEPGKPVPLPADEDPAVTGGKSEPQQNFERERVLAPNFPIRFSSTVDASREWTLKDGHKIQGTPSGRSGQQVTFKTSEGQHVSVDAGLLSDDDRAVFCFWEASRGTPLSIPKLDLYYQMNTSMSGSFEVRVSAEGSMGRVCATDKDGIRVLVFDMKDGAFVSTYIHQGKSKETTRIHVGRFLPEKLLSRKILSRHSQEEVDHFLANVIPQSPGSIWKVAPCRRMLYPLSSGGITFRNPEIDFVLCEQTTIVAGLFQLLCMQTPGKSCNEVYVFAPAGVPRNRDGECAFPILATCRVLPLRIAWENRLNDAFRHEDDRVRNAGKFSLELTRAAIPVEFPGGFFAIPSSVRTMAAGTFQTKESEKER